MFDGENRVRFFVLIGIMAVFLLAGVFRLAQLQIVMGADYRAQSERRLIRPTTIVAPRGEIVDRHGRPLVTNRQGFFIRFQRLNVPRAERAAENDQLNSAIHNLVQIAREEDVVFAQSFPVAGPPFTFEFAATAQATEGQRRAAWLEANRLSITTTADEVIEHFRDRYRISNQHSPAELRDIIAVRYEMEQRQFSPTTPFTFAADVDMSVVQRVREMSMDLPGVFVDVEPIREYVYETLAAHVLGRTGIIFREEFLAMQEAGYNVGMNDIIGRDGMERALERYLRGADGQRSVEQTRGGATAQILDTVHPVSGHYAVLTIDVHVQEAAERALADLTAQMRADSRWRAHRRGQHAYTGAAVAIDVNTGAVIALATYPTYNPSLFNENYAAMIADPHRPMFNRALSGTFAPGSTYKMVPALAALETGVINPNSRLSCRGTFVRGGLGTFRPRCMGVHGGINVAQALSVSCNYFFYDVGWQMGIETMNIYARQLGFGLPTGIELHEERGTLAGPEFTLGRGQDWMPGNTVQAAIGQTYHTFTPVQLANFMAAIANGGTRYRVHLTKEIRNSETNEILRRTEPEVLNTVDMSPENHRAIMEGMRLATVSGTAGGAFWGFPIQTGGKTGTAQTAGHNNGLFVGFAPFDNPQIAVAVVIEDGVGGSAVIPVAREIFEAYFRLGVETEDEAVAEPRNMLLR